jgi:hypothetical protein
VRNPTISKKITDEEWAEIKEYKKLLGEEFKGYKGQAAIDKLMKEKRGHIKGAFHRDEIGDIDLLWGDNDFGLQHIINKRNKQGKDPDNIISNIDNILENGIVSKDNKFNNNFIVTDRAKNRVIISQELRGRLIVYVVTAYEPNK